MTCPVAAWDALWAPLSEPVVVASTDPSKTGGRTMNDLIKREYSGRIFQINPRVNVIKGNRG
jgi:predicted CoA-binding protein